MSATTNSAAKAAKTNRVFALGLCILCAACGQPKDSGIAGRQVFAPSIDPSGTSVDGLVVGHRLMAAGQYELALDSFTRAAGAQGLTPEILTALGSANLALGRLNQSEKLLRRAAEAEPEWSEVWNNLGVVLMERDRPAEASEMFKRAFALDNGASDPIRENLKQALLRLDRMAYGEDQRQDYKLVRRGSGDFLIVTAGT